MMMAGAVSVLFLFVIAEFSLSSACLGGTHFSGAFKIKQISNFRISALIVHRDELMNILIRRESCLGY